MMNHCLLLLAGIAVAGVGADPHNYLRLFLPDEEEFEFPEGRVRREARPESFSDYFKKLQLVQSELTKNASVGEAEIAEVFKRHGLATGNETDGASSTTPATAANTTTELKGNDSLFNSNITNVSRDNSTSDANPRKDNYTSDTNARRGNYTSDTNAGRDNYTSHTNDRRSNYTPDTNDRRSNYTSDTNAKRDNQTSDSNSRKDNYTSDTITKDTNTRGDNYTSGFNARRDNYTSEGLKNHTVVTRNISGDDSSRETATDNQAQRIETCEVSGVSTTTSPPEETGKHNLKHGNSTKSKNPGPPLTDAAKKQIGKPTDAPKTSDATASPRKNCVTTVSPITTQTTDESFGVSENTTTVAPTTTTTPTSWWGVSRKRKHGHYKAVKGGSLLEEVVMKGKAGILNRRRKLD